MCYLEEILSKCFATCNLKCLKASSNLFLFHKCSVCTNFLVVALAAAMSFVIH